METSANFGEHHKQLSLTAHARLPAPSPWADKTDEPPEAHIGGRGECQIVGQGYQFAQCMKVHTTARIGIPPFLPGFGVSFQSSQQG